jgi:hypothetical protein
LFSSPLVGVISVVTEVAVVTVGVAVVTVGVVVVVAAVVVVCCCPELVSTGVVVSPASSKLVSIRLAALSFGRSSSNVSQRDLRLFDLGW